MTRVTGLRSPVDSARLSSISNMQYRPTRKHQTPKTNMNIPSRDQLFYPCKFREDTIIPQIASTPNDEPRNDNTRSPVGLLGLRLSSLATKSSWLAPKGALSTRPSALSLSPSLSLARACAPRGRWEPSTTRQPHTRCGAEIHRTQQRAGEGQRSVVVAVWEDCKARRVGRGRIR